MEIHKALDNLKAEVDRQHAAFSDISSVINDYHFAGTLSEEMALQEIESILRKYYKEATE